MDTGPLVDRPQYPTPTKILGRPRADTEEKVTTTAKIISQSEVEASTDAVSPKVPIAIAIAKRKVVRESDRSDRGADSTQLDSDV